MESPGVAAPGFMTEKQFANWKPWPIEIVDLAIKKGDVP
jgi:hypothetical protein